MCTVSYLPQQGNSFILTSNRDEHVGRQQALPVDKYKINDTIVYYPKDQKAGGSWIASGSNGYTICLLNGAFKAHTSTGNYRKSRGLMLLDFFNYQSPADFIERYDFSNIEPFTLIFVRHQGTVIGLCELRWDGEQTHHLNYDASLPHIWSSVTLYTDEVIQQRQQWFQDWLKRNPVPTKDSILMFHHFGGDGSKENDLVMNRVKKRTVSICCIYKMNATETEITYEDAVNQQLYSTKIITT